MPQNTPYAFQTKKFTDTFRPNFVRQIARQLAEQIEKPPKNLTNAPRQKTWNCNQPLRNKFAGRSVAQPMGVLDLQYGSLVDSIDPPPYPPTGGPRGSKCPPSKPAMEPWAVHFVIIFSLRFWIQFWIRFGSVFGLVLGPSWSPFGRPNRVKLGQKCVLHRYVFENTDVHADLRFSMFFNILLSSRWAQDRLKTGPRRVQER